MKLSVVHNTMYFHTIKNDPYFINKHCSGSDFNKAFKETYQYQVQTSMFPEDEIWL